MSTIDNINDNILLKFQIINSMITNIDNNNSNEIHNKILKYNIDKFYEMRDMYNMQSVILLTDYYNINSKLTHENVKINYSIYGDSLFNINEPSIVITKDDLLELRDIYYNNNYDCTFLNKLNKCRNDFNNNDELIADYNEVYNKFNIFVNSNNIIGFLNGFVDYVVDFYRVYNKKSDIEYISKLYNQYKKTNIIISFNQSSYDICKCGNKMIIIIATSELLCHKCGYITNLVGSVFEDTQFYNQEGTKYKSGTYDPNRHCKFWIERIQAKEAIVIEKEVIDDIKAKIKDDKIENIKNISVEQFRMYLKQTNHTKYNNHVTLIKKMITGYVPPSLSYAESTQLFNYFNMATKVYENIKPKDKSNSVYYPFIISKLLEMIIKNKKKRDELIACIHVQSYQTLIENDKIWKKICEEVDFFTYNPTIA